MDDELNGSNLFRAWNALPQCIIGCVPALRLCWKAYSRQSGVYWKDIEKRSTSGRMRFGGRFGRKYWEPFRSPLMMGLQPMSLNFYVWTALASTKIQYYLLFQEQ